jgi:hypothetical protein
MCLNFWVSPITTSPITTYHASEIVGVTYYADLLGDLAHFVCPLAGRQTDLDVLDLADEAVEDGLGGDAEAACSSVAGNRSGRLPCVSPLRDLPLRVVTQSPETRGGASLTPGWYELSRWDIF